MRERKRDEEARIDRTVAATYVENRVTNHKRVYGGASDHWPQRIIDGYSRCRVSIRRTIEMKGCTRTVKAELVTIPRRTDGRTSRSGRVGIAVPLDTNQSSSPLPPRPFTSLSTPSLPLSLSHVPPTWDAIRLRNAIRTDRPSLSVSNHLLPTPPLARISFFTLFLTNVFSIGCSGLIA